MKRIITILIACIAVCICFLPISQAQAHQLLTENASKKSFTNAEILLIAKVVYAEARGEPFLGKVAVANVVLNRYESGIFGKTVKVVVKRRHQFSVGRRTNDECKQAVLFLINNNLRLLPSNVYYFKRSAKPWRSFTLYCAIGRHHFFTQGIPVVDTTKSYIDENGTLIWVGEDPAPGGQ